MKTVTITSILAAAALTLLNLRVLLKESNVLPHAEKIMNQKLQTRSLAMDKKKKIYVIINSKVASTWRGICSLMMIGILTMNTIKLITSKTTAFEISLTNYIRHTSFKSPLSITISITHSLKQG
jgi:hypothetical protein